MKPVRPWLALFLSILSLTAAARAERYALLVGVGKYQGGIQGLDGPVPDVSALGKEIQAEWGFPRANITELTDAAATKSAILAALDALVGRLKDGDIGFFYYSGHGTSYFDQGIGRERSAVFDPNTGAIVPYDAKIGTAAEVANSLIVGNKEIRPRLTKVAHGATVLVIFDSCYSGGSARSLLDLPARGIAMRDLVIKGTPSEADGSAFGEAPDSGKEITRGQSWPYPNVLYISAASKMEKAIDVNYNIIAQHPTVDKQPHGALTDSLLRGLKGQADTNHDGVITYEELANYARETVQSQFPHLPQFESPGATLSNAPLFGYSRAPSSTVSAASEGITRVRVENVPSPLADRIRALKEIRVVTDTFDLLVRPSPGGGYDLFHSSYDRIQHFAAGEEPALLKRIANQGESRRLVSLAYPHQSFNISLALQRVNGSAGEAEFYVGDRVQAVIDSEKQSYLLLMDIDTSGEVTILYAAITPVPAKKGVHAGNPMRVATPVGLEYIKAIAFQQKPEGFDYWQGRVGDNLSPGSDDFQKLMAFLQKQDAGASQFVAKFVTAKRP